MGINESKITQFALDTLLDFVSGNEQAGAGESPAQDRAPAQTPSAEAKALAQSPQASLAKAAQLFADQAPGKKKSPYPAGSAEDLVEFLNGEGQSLDPLTRTFGYLEAARREGDSDVKTAYLDSAYQEAWNDLSGQERTMVRQAHAQVLLAAKTENDKNDWYDMPGSEQDPVAAGMKKQWLQGRKDTDRSLKEAAFKLAQDWQHSLASGTEVSQDDAAVRVMALTELCAFGVAFGEGIDPRDGTTKKLIGLGKDQGISPRQMLESEIRTYGKDGSPQQKLEQYELAAMAAGRMLDVQWGAGAISILETVRSFDASALKDKDA
ncbi:MAG: hypothetical protein R3257_07095, partial [bacterium]|nr:hypothetical protein [bacterium]